MRYFILASFLAIPAFAQLFEGNVKLLSQRLSVRSAVKNAPYLATSVTELKQTFPDGNEILRTTVSKMARDSKGRVRLEQIEPELHRTILVEDPEAGTGFSYSPGTGHLQVYGTKKGGPPKIPTVQGVSLGKAVLNGVNVEGTRQVTVIPAGQIGNAKPMEIIDESWYSPELQLIVKSLHSDPRSGTSTYRLTSLERKEPEAKLFEPPATSKFED